MLLALLFVPALVALTVVAFRWRRPQPVRVLAEAVPPPATISGDVDPIAALDALLAELEGATVHIGGADELDDSDVVVLERLADKLEAAAASLGGSGATETEPQGRDGRRAAASSVAPLVH